MSKIVVHLKGGLGNQMFQYATGRGLQAAQNEQYEQSSLLLSTHSLSGNPDRDYGLNVFAITAEVATPNETYPVKYPYGVLSKGWRFLAGRFLKQFRTVHFDQSILKKTGDVFLDGYFQSEKYFDHIAEDIRKEFKLKSLSNDAKLLHKTIQATVSSVSVHIRGGDYLNHPHFAGICTKNYYKRALTKIKECFPDATFFVFTNDPAWTKQTLPELDNPIYVQDYDLTDQEELILMSNCDHNIIANSSYSWWAAWLNDNTNKHVLVPEIWAHGEQAVRFKDTVPDSWHKIPIQ